MTCALQTCSETSGLLLALQAELHLAPLSFFTKGMHKGVQLEPGGFVGMHGVV